MATDKKLLRIAPEDEIKYLQQQVLLKADALFDRMLHLPEEVLNKMIFFGAYSNPDRTFLGDIRLFESSLKKARNESSPAIYTKVHDVEWVLMTLDTQSKAAYELQLARIDLLKAHVLVLAHQIANFTDDLILKEPAHKTKFLRNLDQFKDQIEDGNGTHGYHQRNYNIFRNQSKLEKQLKGLSSDDVNLKIMLGRINIERDELRNAIEMASLTPNVQKKIKRRLFLAWPLSIAVFVGLGLIGTLVIGWPFPLTVTAFAIAGSLAVAGLEHWGELAQLLKNNDVPGDKLIKYFATDYRLQTSVDKVLLRSLLPQAEEENIDSSSSTQQIVNDTRKIKDINHVVTDTNEPAQAPDSDDKVTYYAASEEASKIYPTAQITVVSRGTLFHVEGQPIDDKATKKPDSSGGDHSKKKL